MKTLKYLFTILTAIQIRSYAEMPDYYTRVDRIVWVVSDLPGVMSDWRSLGFSNMNDHGRSSITGPQNDQIEVHIASANLGGAAVTWIQPIDKNNAFSDFLEANGDGAFALLHRVPSVMEMENEIKRLGSLNVKPLLRGNVPTDEGPVNFVFMDTGIKGKYVLGLITGPNDLQGSTGTNQLGMKFSQYAFAISDPRPVSDFWAGIGFPEFEITHGETWGKEYYGKPTDFDMKLGWQRHGDIVYEWCIPLKGPTVYADHIKSHGEGIQHLGFTVDDMDEAISYFKNKGYKISMSGGWGDKGQPGSGRFAYVDTEKAGGETIELLWSYNN